jgi:hypothetical protein
MYSLLDRRMSNVKTRLLAWTHLHHLVGSDRQLPAAELPTVGDLIRYGLYLREISDHDSRNYSNSQLVSDLTTGLLAQWCRANPKFTEPVINSHAIIKAKLKSMWEQGNKMSSGRGRRANLEEKDRFMEKLESFMDILACNCDIENCNDVGCSSACVSGVHICCVCSREMKITVIELAFTKGQREKFGTIGPHQIGPVDLRGLEGNCYRGKGRPKGCMMRKTG